MVSLADARRTAHARIEEIAAGVRRVWRESFCEGCISITSPEFERILSETIADAEEQFMAELHSLADTAAEDTMMDGLDKTSPADEMKGT